MCGIAGYISNRPLDRKILSDMVDRLHHRGPDSSGYYRKKQYNAGMCRLTINDLAYSTYLEPAIVTDPVTEAQIQADLIRDQVDLLFILSHTVLLFMIF